MPAVTFPAAACGYHAAQRQNVAEEDPVRLNPIALTLSAALAIVPAFFTAPASAQDSEGCKDSPLLTRLPGCTIS